MFRGVFFNAYAGTDEKENNQSLGKKINDADQDHKNKMIGF